MKNHVLDFYSDASVYEILSQLHYEKKHFYKRFPFDYISMKDIEFDGKKMIIKIDKKMQMFLLHNDDKGKNGIAPIKYVKNKKISSSEELEIIDLIEQDLFERNIEKGTEEWEEEKRKLEIKEGLYVDSNKLIFSPLNLELIFEDESTTLYIPLIKIDITDFKEKMLEHDYNKGSFNLEIDIEHTDIEYNEFATDLFLKDTFKEIYNSLLYIANSDEPMSKKELFEKLYLNVKENLEKKHWDMFRISFPDLNGDSSVIGLFFGIDSEEINSNIEKYHHLKNSTNPLLKEYLEKETKENHSYEYCDEIYYGAMTDIFPLGKGQSIVMEKNQLDENLISVIGPPGTGKTTLFLSIVANNVVKRAMKNIFEGEDYNNMMLVTSTSNKAVENVFSELKRRFPEGFCYVGGNYENRKRSNEEVSDFLTKFSQMAVPEGTLEELEGRIRKIVDIFQSQKEKYLQTKEEFRRMGITKPEHIKHIRVKKVSEKRLREAEEFIEEAEDLVEEINALTDSSFSLQEIIEFVKTKDYYTVLNTAKRLGNMNFFMELLGFDKVIMKRYTPSDERFKLSNKEHIVHLGECLQTIQKYKKEILRNLDIVNENALSVRIENTDKKYLSKVLATESFGEFFRIYFFRLNYDLFTLSKEYLEMKALARKDDVIEALETLISGEMYAVKNPEKMLKDISLIYPVITTTIAGFKNMFRNLDEEIVYDSVLADEAGMIKVQDLIPILAKSKRAVVVGDPKQLPPIITMHDLFSKFLRKQINDDEAFFKYSPTEVSAYHRAAGTIKGGYKATGYGVLLDEHRRCQAEIANLFIKVGEYDGVKIMTQPKDIRDIHPFKSRVVFFDVMDRSKKDKYINQKEIEAIEKILDVLDSSEHFDIQKDVGIITPYHKQEYELIKRIGERVGHSKEEKKIGTVHKFQGTEYKAIIFSPVVSSDEDSLRFINKDPSLINVSISRAKELFIVVGDFDKVNGNDTGNYIGKMARLMENNLTSIDDISLFH